MHVGSLFGHSTYEHLGQPQAHAHMCADTQVCSELSSTRKINMVTRGASRFVPAMLQVWRCFYTTIVAILHLALNCCPCITAYHDSDAHRRLYTHLGERRCAVLHMEEASSCLQFLWLAMMLLISTKASLERAQDGTECIQPTSIRAELLARDLLFATP